jgi:hypothetical protein
MKKTPSNRCSFRVPREREERSAKNSPEEMTGGPKLIWSCRTAGRPFHISEGRIREEGPAETQDAATRGPYSRHGRTTTPGNRPEPEVDFRRPSFSQNAPSAAVSAARGRANGGTRKSPGGGDPTNNAPPTPSGNAHASGLLHCKHESSTRRTDAVSCNFCADRARCARMAIIRTRSGKNSSGGSSAAAAVKKPSVSTDSRTFAYSFVGRGRCAHETSPRGG